MKKMLLISMLVPAMLLLSESVFASSSVTSRILSQEVRIQKGCEKGQLTIKEEKVLKKEHERIKSLFKRLTKSRALSKKDERLVHKQLNKASVHIFKKRYNNKSDRKGRHKH